jgi:MFS family permease
VASLLVVRLADEWFTFLPAAAVEPIRRDLDLNYQGIGVLLVLLTAGGVVGGVFGVTADRVSRRAQATLGALGSAIGFGAFAVGHRAWVLAAGALLIGMSSDAVLSACEVALVDLAGDDLAGALAPGTVAAELGDLLGPLLVAGTAALGWSWRAPFLLATLVWLLYAAVLASQPIPPPAAREGRDGAVLEVRGCLHDRRVWVLGVISLLFDTLDEPLLGFAIAFLEEDRGQSHGLAVLVGGSVVVGGIVGATFLALRGGGERVVPARSAVALAAAIVGIVAAPTVPLQVAAGLAAGVASATFWVRLQAGILGLRPGQAGTTAAVVAYLALPGGLVPLGAAAVADRFGLAAALGCYVAIAVVLAAVTAMVGGSLCLSAQTSSQTPRRSDRPRGGSSASPVPPVSG